MRNSIPLTALLRGPIPRALLLGVALLGCTPDPSSGLLGRWELEGEDYALRIEFAPDGRYRAHTPTGLLEGRWTLVDRDHLATWSGDARPRKVSRFVLRADRLVVYPAPGQALSHRRVP